MSETYFEGINGTSGWSGVGNQWINPDNAWDGSFSTYSEYNIPPSTSDPATYLLLNTWENIPASTDIITKVEVGVYYWAESSTLALWGTPVYNGTTDGTKYLFPEDTHITWKYRDITNDVLGPGTWSWSDLQNLDIKITAGNGDGSKWRRERVYEIRLRITHEPATCTYGLDSTGATYNYQDTTGSIDITTEAWCSWDSTSNDSWLTITSGGSGIDDGTLYYSVDKNTTPFTRIGTLIVAGIVYTVIQGGLTCVYSIDPTSASYNYQDSTGSVEVTATDDIVCAWDSTSNVSWLTILSGGSGIGNGTLYYNVDSNISQAIRVGTMIIAGELFTVNQSALYPQKTFEADIQTFRYVAKNAL